MGYGIGLWDQDDGIEYVISNSITSRSSLSAMLSATTAKFLALQTKDAFCFSYQIGYVRCGPHVVLRIGE